MGGEDVSDMCSTPVPFDEPPKERSPRGRGHKDDAKRCPPDETPFDECTIKEFPSPVVSGRGVQVNEERSEICRGKSPGATSRVSSTTAATSSTAISNAESSIAASDTLSLCFSGTQGTVEDEHLSPPPPPPTSSPPLVPAAVRLLKEVSTADPPLPRSSPPIAHGYDSAASAYSAPSGGGIHATIASVCASPNSASASVSVNYSGDDLPPRIRRLIARRAERNAREALGLRADVLRGWRGDQGSIADDNDGGIRASVAGRNEQEDNENFPPASAGEGGTAMQCGLAWAMTEVEQVLADRNKARRDAAEARRELVEEKAINAKLRREIKEKDIKLRGAEGLRKVLKAKTEANTRLFAESEQVKERLSMVQAVVASAVSQTGGRGRARDLLQEIGEVVIQGMGGNYIGEPPPPPPLSQPSQEMHNEKTTRYKTKMRSKIAHMISGKGKKNSMQENASVVEEREWDQVMKRAETMARMADQDSCSTVKC